MRKRITILLSSLLVLGGVLAAVALAQPSATSLQATLNVAQEVPKAKGAPAAAGGTFSGTLSGTTFRWKLSFQGLSGKVTAVHIHTGAKGKAGGVLIALCGAGCQSPVSGAALVSSTVANALKSGRTYVNVHTAKNPNGEIRGQIR
jgi:hypothetical protein